MAQSASGQRTRSAPSRAPTPLPGRPSRRRRRPRTAPRCARPPRRRSRIRARSPRALSRPSTSRSIRHTAGGFRRQARRLRVVARGGVKPGGSATGGSPSTTGSDSRRALRRVSVDPAAAAARCSASRRPRARGERGARPRRPTRLPRARASTACRRPGSSGSGVGGRRRGASGSGSRARRAQTSRPGRRRRASPRGRRRERVDEMVAAQPRVAEDLELRRRTAPIRRRASARRPRAGRAAGPTAGWPRTRSRRWCPTSPRTSSSSDALGGCGSRACVPSRARAASPARSATTPRISARSGSGVVERRTNTLDRAARSSTPFFSSRSQRRNQRMSSGTRSMCGPGSEVAVDMWLHGPTSRRFGHSQRLERAERVVAVAVRPAADEHRRRTRFARSRAAAIPGASTARRAAPRASAAATAPGLEPPHPLVAPAVAEHRRHGWRARQRRHVEDVVEEIERRAAPRRCSGRRPCSGRRWSRWRRRHAAQAAARLRPGGC